MARRKAVSLRSIVPHYRHGSESDGEANINGEPTMIALRRFQNDRTLRGSIWTECCDCGLKHLYVYEVFPDPDNHALWWMTKRPHRGQEQAQKRKQP